jgi:RHS repeat-associated protein
MSSPTNWAANYFSLTPVTSVPGTTATTTYAYDNNGNVTAVGTTTTYSYDFENRLTQSIIGNGHATTTTTYGYDPFGSRVFQGTGTATTTYPNLYYSIVATTVGSSTIATSTDYVYGGTTLFATLDQKMVNGTATGTAITRYNHPDNLGSTQVTSDSSGNFAQWFDYAPYGSLIASYNTGTTTAARQYIGQMYDQGTGLSYLNARYYSSLQGQFLSQDPMFGGDPRQQVLTDPQSLNAYSYSENNPIIKKDPTGRIAGWDDLIASGVGGVIGFDYYTIASFITNQQMNAGDAMSAFTAGAMMGEGIDNAPETGGTSIEIALAAIRAGANLGAKASLAGEASKQGLGLLTGNQTSVDYSSLSISPVKGYISGGLFEGALSDATVCVPGVTCGQSNIFSNAQGLGTKYASGAIQGVSSLTSFKSAFSSQINGSLKSLSGAVFDAGLSKSSSQQGSGSTQSFGNAVSTWQGAFNPSLPH